MGEVVSDRRHGKETQSDGSSLAGSRREDCTDRGDPPWPVGHRVSLQTPLRSRSDRRAGGQPAAGRAANGGGGKENKGTCRPNNYCFLGFSWAAQARRFCASA